MTQTPAAPTLPDWRSWLGLPHAFGASPEDGQACDCLVMVWMILDAAGVRHPAFDPKWIYMAAAREWHTLQLIWEKSTISLPSPEPFAVALFHNGSAGLGVGVVIDDGVLMVHHRRGVVWVPCNLLRLSYSRFR